MEFKQKAEWLKNSTEARKQSDGEGGDWFSTQYAPATDTPLPPPEKDDVVWIQAKVVQGYPHDLGCRVVLFSKTDQYEAMIATNHLIRVIEAPVAPAEPPVGTWLGAVDDQGGPNVFVRLPGGWYDVGMQQELSWVDAYRRGAHPSNLIRQPLIQHDAVVLSDVRAPRPQ